MTDEDRKRIATAAVRGMSTRCSRPGGGKLEDGSAFPLCTGTLRMTGLFIPGATSPTIIIRCSLCDAYDPGDDA